MNKKQILLLAFIVFQVVFSPAAAQTTFTHPWQGRRVAYLGDSITDPRNSGSKKKWWHFLQDWLQIEPYVYAISGRQWNDIPNQADRLLEISRRTNTVFGGYIIGKISEAMIIGALSSARSSEKKRLSSASAAIVPIYSTANPSSCPGVTMSL